MLDKDLKVQQAKTDKSLFKHFFITNMTDLDEGHFMLNGIGYEQGKASDIYFLPFTTSGQSSCDLKSYDVSNTALASNLDTHYFTNFSTSASSVQTQNAEFQLVIQELTLFCSAKLATNTRI